MINLILPTEFKPGTIVVEPGEIYLVLDTKQIQTGTQIIYLTAKDLFKCIYEPEFKHRYDVL